MDFRLIKPTSPVQSSLLPALRLHSPDEEWATELLCAACMQNTQLRGLLSGPHQARQAKLLLRGLARYGLLFGKVYALPEHQAMVLWLPPGHTILSLGRLGGIVVDAVAAGLARFSAVVTVSAERFSATAAQSECTALLLAGFGGAAGGARTRSGQPSSASHARRHARRAHALLPRNAEHPRHLGFYQQLGFRVANKSAIDASGVPIWGLVRPAEPLAAPPPIFWPASSPLSSAL